MQDVLTDVEKIVSVAYATYVAKPVGAGQVFFLFSSMLEATGTEFL